MPPTQDSPSPAPRQAPSRHTRQQVAQATADWSDPDRPAPCQRDFARQHGIPRSTLQGWLDRQRALADQGDLDPDTLAFLHSPPGEALLRRLVLACHLVFHQHGDCGLRPLARWLSLTGLGRFVGASYGSTQATALALEALLGQFADQERRRLAAQMAPKQIAVVADEHFHDPSGPCLVALEPVSNFLLLEEYAPDRTADTWKGAVTRQLQGLPVTPALLTSDQAKGLIACAERLGLPHSPELFHLQRDLAAPLLAGLGRATADAQGQYEQAQEHTQAVLRQQQEYREGPPRPGRPPDFEGIWLPCATRREEAARQRLVASEGRQEQALAAVRGLGDDYHPFDGRSGAPVGAEELGGRLSGRLTALRALAAEAGLSESARQAVEKALGWVGALAGVMAFFWGKARALVEALGLCEEAERVVYDKLLAGRYWAAAARRARDAEQRRRLKELSERLLGEAWAKGGPLDRLTEQEKGRVRQAAVEAVGLFSRSSSAVEGRNGRLSLYRHGQSRLSEGRLKALSCLHNYFSQRPDGTTAAQRFFGAKPRDLFAWLTEHMPDLPRPRRASQAQDPGAQAA